MNIFEGDKYLGAVRGRPLAIGSIIRYQSVNYDVLEDHGAYIRVKRRGGVCGQVATPDYNLDDIDDKSYPREFIVMTGISDSYVGKITLEARPYVGQKLEVGGKAYSVVDWSIGQRMTDEVYVS